MSGNRLRRSLAATTARVSAVAVLPDGRVVSGGDDHRVLVWDPDMSGEPTPGPVWPPRRLGVSAVAVLPDGRVVRAEADGRVLVWDLARSGCCELGRHDRAVQASAALGPGWLTLAATTVPCTRWRCWQMGGWRQRRSRWAGAGLGFGRAWDGPGRARPGLGPRAGGGSAARWTGGQRRGRSAGTAVGLGHGSHCSLSNGRPPRPHGVSTVLPDGRVVSSGTDRRVWVWDRDGPVEIGSHNKGVVLGLAVLPDGRVVSSGVDGRILVWDPAATELGPVELVDYGDPIPSGLAVLPDGRLAPAGRDGDDGVRPGHSG